MSENHDREYSLTEFCELAHVQTELVTELVSAGVLEPEVRRDIWYFRRSELSRCMKASRLMQDLEINLHGAALALELMDQNRRLRRRMAHLEHLVARLYDRD